MGALGRVISLVAMVGAVAMGIAQTPAITPLPTSGKFDYQLGGGYTPPDGVTIVARDSTDVPVAGIYNICYVNGFQTQDYQKSFWLKKHPTLVLRDKHHKPVSDPGWPGEMLLDSSTAKKRTGITKVMAVTIAACANKGFQAVEFDNLDSYSRSHGRLTKADNVTLATRFVASAHSHGLAAAQKNTVELGKVGRDTIHFDFAVAEQCYRYDECAGYTSVYGDNVVDIEYTNDLRGTFSSDCAATDRPTRMILRDVDLTTPSSKKYTYQSC